VGLTGGFVCFLYRNKKRYQMACWCETNDKEKTKSIADAEARISDLTTKIEELTASSARLNTEIKNLEKEVAANQNALDKATAIRQKQLAEFNGEEKDKAAERVGGFDPRFEPRFRCLIESRIAGILVRCSVYMFLQRITIALLSTYGFVVHLFGTTIAFLSVPSLV